MKLIHKVIDNNGQTIKDILRKEFNMSNRLINKLKLNKKILLNMEYAYINNVPLNEDIITVDLDYDEEDDIIEEQGDLKVLYEDDWYIAVDKPAKIVVHPCSYHPNGTLANYVKAYLHNKRKIRPVNRLDNGTSGVVLFAKNEYAQESFIRMKTKANKIYLALVHGRFEESSGIINAPIERKPNSIIERCVNFNNGKEAITHYKVIKEIKIKEEYYSLLEVSLETGRTHQIRVHMAYIKHPIVGDTLYNANLDLVDAKIDRQALHAHKLEFIHPITKEFISIESKLPEDILGLI